MEKYANLAFLHTFTRKPIFDKLLQFIELYETNFLILIVKNLFSIESHEILIQIEWDLFHCDLEVKSFHMNSSYFFRVLVTFSSSMHGFVVQPMFTKFENLSNYESHWDWKSHTWIIHMHTQAFKNIS